VLLRLFIDNLSVYGARKLWMAAQRAGHDIGRDQVARLMGDLGIQGVRRQRHVRTTGRPRGRHAPPTWSTGTSPRSPQIVCG
jgi:transposase InsO family protein